MVLLLLKKKWLKCQFFLNEKKIHFYHLMRTYIMMYLLVCYIFGCTTKLSCICTVG